MPLLNSGRDHIATTLIGAAVTPFDNTNAHIGVGDGTAVFAATQTDLQGVNKTRKVMDATFPTRSTNVLTFRATFGTGEANHAWDEWIVANAATAGTALNRKVEALGTKTSAQSWQITATVTVTAA